MTTVTRTTIEAEHARLQRENAELRIAADRWAVARLNVTGLYQRYARDERHDRLAAALIDVGAIADLAVDGLRAEAASEATPPRPTIRFTSCPRANARIR
ncbi:MAG: hypothetical protein HOP28_12985 [Gemmatimonadales bacterium]|nr:hypothetical protein [Gemmatimonadales bacterium]